MPIYEYKCEQCGETFEILQKVNEEPLTECIVCHEGPVKKLISVSSFVLKGAGFYVNDYPSSSRKQTQEKEKSSSPSDSSTSKSESTSSTDKKTSSE
ncbi:zinc ribbon domain-containing protein [candidate division KSB3 bacterium]|uniref:Zinc ribbon domain-containing protein n=1 Tax=candidate division KSB3 bacterium TaxID=2044937 RepID=A0A9D5JVF5_9BACT|nr:zinc ribbon domain-containing protein [candidate division KSB3 bacterium]MBD3324651.1 zinc ribbon domain-containing protein [candidate division KSB3 bacterium]